MAERPCACDNCEVGGPWRSGAELIAAGQCVMCWKFHNDDRYNRLWGGPGVRPRRRCRHLGAETRRVECPTCPKNPGGKVQLKVFACGVHGECTPGKPVDGVRGCCAGADGRGCPQYEPVEPYPGGVVRNLLYHVAPAAGNGVWRRNVAQLLKRIDLFNGRRVVAVVTGTAKRLDYRAEFPLDPPDAVKEAFRGHVHEFIELPNDPQLREVVTFLPLLDRVATTAASQITFYGHAKGVTRPADGGTTVHRWTDLLYETCLDYPALVERQLEVHPVTGSFKKVGFCFADRGFRSESAFHYSGSFWWMRNSMVFGRPWRRVDDRWWGNEAWPGVVFRPQEAGCLFHQGGPEMDLFRMEYLKERVEPAYEAWKAAHAGERRAP